MTTAGPAVPVGGDVDGDVVVGPALSVGGAGAGPGVVVVPVTSGAGHTYEHTQRDPAAVWVIDHNLGRYPAAWSLRDQDGRLRDEFLVDLPTVNRAVIRMDIACAGTISMI